MRNEQKTSASLRSAVINGDLQAVEQFLEDPECNVDETDETGNTALLLATCVKNDYIYNAIVQGLIKRGANVNAYNKGFTPLYNAVFYRKEESVRQLLKAGAWLRPDHYHEIHLLAEFGGSNILRMFLNDCRITRDILNQKLPDGRSALHIAAQESRKNCLKLLIKHGGDLLVKNNDGESVIDVIYEHILRPEEFFRDILEDCISAQQLGQYKWEYIIDFGVLAGRRGERQMEVLSNIVLSAGDEEKTKALQHPVIELFLILKWRKICGLFYFWIAIYFLFAVSLGIYVTLMAHNMKQHVMFKIVKYILILTSAGLLGHALLQYALIIRNYLERYELSMNVICTSLSLIVAIASNMPDVIDGNETPEWILHTSSVAVLMAWIELMLLVGRLPSLGYYALMFSAVVQNVFKVLMAFSCLVIGFVLTFSIEFRDTDAFSTIWGALVKTTVMMTGEYEYADFSGLRGLGVTAKIFFLIFILLASIIMMNLMVGLIVSDIQELHTLGRSKNLEKQIEFICQLEKVLSSLENKYLTATLRMFLRTRSYIDVKYKVKSSADFIRDQKIPRHVIDAIIARGKQQKKILEKK